jgi:hypothetical protein
MPGDKRPEIQRLRDRHTIAELMCKGWGYQKIADYLELSKPTICREVKAIRAAWQEETIADRNEYVQMEMQRLRLVESEFWAAWGRSQENQTTITEVDALSSVEAQMQEAIGGAPIKTSTKVQQQSGNPQFLNGVVKVIETRCKLLGLFPDGSTAGGQLQMSEQQLQVLGQLMMESTRHG